MEKLMLAHIDILGINWSLSNLFPPMVELVYILILIIGFIIILNTKQLSLLKKFVWILLLLLFNFLTLITFIVWKRNTTKNP